MKISEENAAQAGHDALCAAKTVMEKIISAQIEGPSAELAALRQRVAELERLLVTSTLGAEIVALQASLAAAESDAAAGRKLWAFMLDNQHAWSEDMLEFVDMGLLKAVDMTKPDSPERCENCDGDCDACYRPTELLRSGGSEGL